MSLANWTDEMLIQRVKEGFDNSADDKFLCNRICEELAIRYKALHEKCRIWEKFFAEQLQMDYEERERILNDYKKEEKR